MNKIYMLLIAIVYDKGDSDTISPFTDLLAMNGGFRNLHP